MSRRSVVVLVLVLLLAALMTGSALAQSGTKLVGLVVAFPNGTAHQQIVTVPSGATAFEVLQAASITLASQTTAYGPAVCSINATGCPATNCFCDASHYWAYYHLNAAGNAWISAAEGVGAYVPANGAAEGFAWSGFDASFNPTVQPPVYTFAQIVAMTTPPVAVPEPGTLLLLGSGIVGLAGYIRLRTGRRA